MNYKVLTLALAASAFGSFAASAQTTTIIEQRPGVVIEHRPVVIEQRPAVVVEPAPQTTITTQEARRFPRHRVEGDHDDYRDRHDRRLRDAHRRAAGSRRLAFHDPHRLSVS